MECVCGCGTEVPRNLIPAQLEAGKVAPELLVWDRTRTGAPQSAETHATGALTDEEFAAAKARVIGRLG